MPRLIAILALTAASAQQAGAPAADALARHRNLGKAFFENPTTQKEAVAEFSRAVALAPGSARDRLNLGLALLAAGRTSEGITEIERVQRQDPSLPHTWFNLGIQYKKAGEYDKATRQLEQMAKLAPSEPVTHYNLGVLYKVASRMEDARREFETASRRNPSLAAPHFQLYNLLRQQGKREEAMQRLALFQAAKKQAESNPAPEDMEWSAYSEVYEVIPALTAFDIPPAPKPPFAPLPPNLPPHRGFVWLDYDHDNDLDLILLGDKCTLLRNQQEAGWVDRTADFPFVPGKAVAAAVIRLIPDTRPLDLVMAYEDHVGVLYRDKLGGKFEAVPLDPLAPAPGRLQVADVNHDSFVDVVTGAYVLLNRDGKFTRAPLPAKSAPLGGNWIEVRLEGVKNPKRAEHSEIEVKAGSLYRKYLYYGAPLRIDLGRANSIDQLRITWPNGLIQSEARQPVNRAVTYKEAQRLSGSCPQVFTWNGRGFEYVTDILGVAPLGAASGDGSTFPVDDEEAIVIPGHALAPRDGRYEIRLTEELAEVAFIDQARLLAVDHQPDDELLVNEKFQPPPYPPLEFFLARRTASPARNPLLVLRGWIQWADGSEFLAAAQRGKPLELPRLEEEEGGSWRTLVANMGLPAGKPKTLTVELPHVPARYRIVSNLDLHWTERYLAEKKPAPPHREAALASSEVRFRGFSRLASYRPETFLYADPLPESRWNPTPGLYTRYGAVTPLTAAADDRYVIMGSGDELMLRFAALPPPAPGLVRDFVFIVNGWAKDQDANTAHSQTVEPLPFRGMSRYPYPDGEPFPAGPVHNRWMKEYNTRPALRLLRPLREATE